MPDTGNGATLTFATSAFTAEITSIDGNEASRPVLPTDHLGTTVRVPKMPGDLVDEGEMTIEFYLDPDVQPPINGAAETITLTFPSTAALIGTGFVSKWKWGSLKNNELVKATATITWDGLTGPAWSDAPTT